MSPRKTTFWQFCLINLFLEPYSGAEGELSTAHAVHIRDLLAISVDKAVIISDSHLENMEEVRSDRGSEHDIESSEASLRIHSAILHPILKIKERGTAGSLDLSVVKVVVNGCYVILKLCLILIF